MNFYFVLTKEKVLTNLAVDSTVINWAIALLNTVIKNTSASVLASQSTNLNITIGS